VDKLSHTLTPDTVEERKAKKNKRKEAEKQKMWENEVVLMARGNIFSFFLHPPRRWMGVQQGFNPVG
jgi:hypothetical protein